MEICELSDSGGRGEFEVEHGSNTVEKDIYNTDDEEDKVQLEEVVGDESLEEAFGLAAGFLEPLLKAKSDHCGAEHRKHDLDNEHERVEPRDQGH